MSIRETRVESGRVSPLARPTAGKPRDVAAPRPAVPAEPRGAALTTLGATRAMSIFWAEATGPRAGAGEASRVDPASLARIEMALDRAIGTAASPAEAESLALGRDLLSAITDRLLLLRPDSTHGSVS